MTQRVPLIVPAVLSVLVVAGLGFGVGPLAALVAVGALSVAVLLLGISSGAVGLGAPARSTEARATIEESTAPFYAGLGWALGLAVVVRLLAVAMLNGTSLWISFAPDALYWQYSGAALLAHWADPGAPLTPWLNEGEAWPFYSVLNGVVLAVFGTSRIPTSLLNGFISIWAAFNIGALAQLIYGREAGRRAFLLTLFFPSIVLWSSMNIREAWSILVISYALLFTHRLRQRFSPTAALMLVGSIAAMFYIRSYLVPLLMTGIALSYLVVRVRQIPYAIAALVLLAVFGVTFGPSVGLDPSLLSSDSLEAVDRMRHNLAFGGSAYGNDADTRTLAGALAYLPEGIVRFLMAPFPWAVRSTRQIMTVPESFLWYGILGVALWSMIKSLRTHLTRMAPTFFVLVLITSAYGLVSGNEGTAYRHRAQVLVLFFVFASARPLFSGRRRR